MQTRTRAVATGVGIAILGISCAMMAVPTTTVTAAVRAPMVTAGEYTLSGPYAHENLTIFLIHGQDKMPSKTFLTLQEALAQKKAIVHETGSVNEVSVENLSSDVEVFIQSGDIVKGGQQDRIMAFDVIVPAKSGKVSVRVPIASFCVEAGRWQQRGGEAVAVFGSSAAQAPSKEIKLAAKASAAPAAVAGSPRGVGIAAGRGVRAIAGEEGGGGQGSVWMEVAALQEKLKMSLQSEVQAAESRSSLQLTIENKNVQEAAGKYVRALASIIDGQKDVIGYAFAINGTVSSADVYASHALFTKLWPKLLKASAVEALAGMPKDKKYKPATAEAVKACLADAEKGEKSAQDITKRVQLQVQETKDNILFETRDREGKETWIHRNYLKK